MNRPLICAVIINDQLEKLDDIRPLVDLFEVRIDLVGDGWTEVARKLDRPWIACNRCPDEGGKWAGKEARRIEELLRAIELGAAIIDIELRTNNLGNIVKLIKRKAKCLLSVHDFQATPPLNELKQIVNRQIRAGADICKVVTTATRAEDNLTVLKLVTEFPQVKMVSFAMGGLGLSSRILSPLVGGDFTYAAVERGGESAPGQITVSELRQLYEMVVI